MDCIVNLTEFEWTQPYSHTFVNDGVKRIPHSSLDNGLSWLPENAGKILCCGIGDGYELDKLLREGKDAVGITISEAEFKHFPREGIPADKTFLMDMHDLKFADGQFNTIYSRHNFEHSICPWLAILNFNRVLQNAGKCLIIIPNERGLNDQSHVPYSVMSPAQFIVLARHAGFMIDKTEHNIDWNEYKYLMTKFKDYKDILKEIRGTR